MKIFVPDDINKYNSIRLNWLSYGNSKSWSLMGIIERSKSPLDIVWILLYFHAFKDLNNVLNFLELFCEFLWDHLNIITSNFQHIWD